MSEYSFEDLSFAKAMELYKDKVEAVVVADDSKNRIRILEKKGIFADFLKEEWNYNDLIEKLWYHFNNSSQAIVEDYQVFIPTAGKFSDKYSRRVNLVIDNVPHVTQFVVFPIGEDLYLFFLDELDKSLLDEDSTNKKVDTIQSIYLFSMYLDIVKDTTSSISVTEISDEVVNQQLKYSEWRMMIVNMIAKEYQKQFLEETDPETLKQKYAPGQTSSFDCLMMNLEGVYIWVKLIFSRAETNNNDDYRFVFMVQNIHEESMELRKTLKKYEKLASVDSLTAVYNHGRIETELDNALAERSRRDTRISIMMLDIDFFKKINDKFGHAAGDVTLVAFSNTIQSMLEGRNAIMGRWGGEEFVVVCYDTSLDEAKELAENIRKSIEETVFDKIGHLTCSIGITEIKADDRFEDTFERMDSALYKAKSDGRNCVRVG